VSWYCWGVRAEIILLSVLWASSARVDGPAVAVDGRNGVQLVVHHGQLGDNSIAGRSATAWFAERFDPGAYPRAQVHLWRVIDGDGESRPVAIEVHTPQRLWRAAFIAVDDPLVCLRATERMFPCETFVDDTGETLLGSTQTSPVEYRIISSRVGFREHPVKKREHFHRGTDYVAPEGAPITSIDAGVVSALGRSYGAGRYVVVSHDDGSEAKYFHLAEHAVVKGDRVDRGQRVGTVGHSGRVTGTHLHFELRGSDGILLDAPAVRRAGAAYDARWGQTVRDRFTLLNDPERGQQ
jgi:murein DD-endopeptidase MepM/ murein hydrolase activator NlpD